LALALVRDLREHRAAASAEELADFETDVLAGFVLARASAGLADSTIRNDTGHLELIRDWFGRPLWEMQPADADSYFGKVLREAKPSTRTGRAAALTVYFQFLELRHKIELHNLTGRVVECPLDEMNRPRTSVDPQLRIPPAEAEIEQLFTGWRGDWPPAASSLPLPGTTRPPGWPPTSACGSTRPGCWTWTTCGGNWAGSASSTSATARARGGEGPNRGWCR
jgi:hypothetical protein